MKHRGVLALMLLAALLAGCHDAGRNNTAVLGGHADVRSQDAGAPPLTDARGRAIPAPPTTARAQTVRTGDEAALAAWIDANHAVASSWTPQGGWSAPQPLERIYGESSDVQLAGNGQGQAIAVWHHRVGNIHSLRFSRFDGSAWSPPDVLPGAMPRPAVAGAPPGLTAPQLQMDAQGNVRAQWPSGFHANENQVARYSVTEGWSRAASAPAASAPSASPARPASSSAP